MKRAIFDLIKKAKFFTAKGWKGKNAMMNDNLNARSPSALHVCLFLISFNSHDGLCFIVPLMIFTINQKSWRTFNETNGWEPFTC